MKRRSTAFEFSSATDTFALWVDDEPRSGCHGGSLHITGRAPGLVPLTLTAMVR